MTTRHDATRQYVPSSSAIGGASEFRLVGLLPSAGEEVGVALSFSSILGVHRHTSAGV